jgi:hypothetical protein
VPDTIPPATDVKAAVDRARHATRRRSAHRHDIALLAYLVVSDPGTVALDALAAVRLFAQPAAASAMRPARV